MIGTSQLFRYDTCDPIPRSSQLKNRILANLESLLQVKSIERAIIGDYHYDLCHEDILPVVIDMLKCKGIPIFVDPHGKNFSKYKGCNVFKLNITELEMKYECDVNNMEDYVLCSKMILDEVQCDVVFITLGAKGIFYFNKEFHGIVPSKRDVAGDVCGCGDIVISTISQLYQHNMSEDKLITMLRIANDFAAINLHKTGAAKISVADWIRIQETPIQLKPEQAVSLSIFFKRRSIKIGVTTGCFDLIHAGHVRSLQFAKKQCDMLFVFINSDESVRNLKGDHRPVIPLEHRLEMLLSMQWIDFVVVFEERDFDPWLKELHLDVFVKSGDYTADFLSKLCEKYKKDIEIKICPLLVGISTSSIEKTILERHKIRI